MVLKEIYFNEYKYAAISVASSDVTPRLGITVFSFTECGSRTQRTRFNGSFGKLPATYRRAPIPERDGPTSPCAPAMPGIAWHDPHPYREI